MHYQRIFNGEFSQTSTVPRANSAAASFIIYIFFKKYYYYIVGFVDLLLLFCLNCPD